MAADRYDITLDGNKFRIYRDGDSAGYEKRFERRQVLDQAARQSTRQALTSRADRSLVYQNDWSGGSAWWKPMTDPLSATMYHTNTAMDAFSKPGVVLPTNAGVAPALGLTANTPMFSDGAELYAIGATNAVEAAELDLVKWGGANWAAVATAGSGALVAKPQIFGVAFTRSDEHFYLLGLDYIAELDPATASLPAWLALPANSKPGDSIFVSVEGVMFVYNAGIIKSVNRVTPALTDAVDDGFGADMLADMAFPASPRMPASASTLVASASSGIFYAKNVISDGQPLCYLSHVDRDASGAYLRRPLTTLPRGLVCVNIINHLGSVIMACTRDWRLLMDNDRTVGQDPVIEFYAWTQGSGLSVIGSPDRERPDEMPARFLGSDNEYLYIGSGERIWVYDGARGGIHPWLNPPDQTGGLYEGVATANLTSGGQVLMLKRGNASTYYPTHSESPTTVSALGDDLVTYTMESNYFDFGIPFENKFLQKVSVHTEALATAQRWTVQVSVDDGAFATVATFSNGSYFAQDLVSLSLSGKRFRYKLIYETTAAALRGLQGIQFTAIQGVMVPVWEMVLNGREVIGVENKVMDPEQVHDYLETSAAKFQTMTLVDNFRSQTVSDTASSAVTVETLRVLKSDPNEALFHVVLVGEA